MNKSPDAYLKVGCGRCPLGGTPQCKVHNWTEELKLLRQIALQTDVEEESKWGVLCYTYESKNVFLISAFNDFCSVSFFKGILLDDPGNHLLAPGPNSHAARILKYNSVDDIKNQEAEIIKLISQAIDIEIKGIPLPERKQKQDIPEELNQTFEEDPLFKSAFESLTPGRQRGYLIYFSAPKKPETRKKRIQDKMAQILNGEGMHDKYKRSMK